jgi:hypothetical protein
MRPHPTCPRCGGALQAPGLWSSAWQCARHGAVLPYTVATRMSADALEHVRRQARVPLWAPWPLPPSWLVTGLGWAGDDRTGARATVLACSGPSPLGGPADLLLVSEEPGVGLGCRYGGLPGTDPGAGFDLGAPDAKVEAASHPTALWALPTEADCAVFAGEAKGLWLWAIVWPASAGILLYDSLVLTDLRDAPEADFAFGGVTPRLLSAG